MGPKLKNWSVIPTFSSVELFPDDQRYSREAPEYLARIASLISLAKELNLDRERIREIVERDHLVFHELIKDEVMLAGVVPQRGEDEQRRAIQISIIMHQQRTRPAERIGGEECGQGILEPAFD